MKKLSLLSMSAALLALGACSDDKGLTVSPTGNESPVAAGENGYLAININLPSTSANSSRANDNFDDGVTNEYRVRNAMLILLSGEDEQSATVKYAYDLGLTLNTSAENAQITTQGSRTLEVKKSQDTNFALVLLNAAHLFNIYNTKLYDAKGDILSTVISSDDDSNTTTEEGYTLSKLTNILVNDVNDITSNGFLMANTVLTEMKGNSYDKDKATTNILVRIDDCIKETQAAAENHTADICVERAMAKVGVSSKSLSTSDMSLDNSIQSISKVTATIESWHIANMAPSSHLIRNWPTDNNGYDNSWYALSSNSTSADQSNLYRFAGTQVIQVTENQISQGGFDKIYQNDEEDKYTYYRTYWGLSPTYSDGLHAEGKTGFCINGEDMNVGDYDYCLENTFDVERQRVQNTTSVVVALTLDLGLEDRTFYRIDEDYNTIYTEEQVKNAVAEKLNNIIGLEQAYKDALAELPATNNDEDGTVAAQAADEKVLIKVSQVKFINDTKAGHVQITAIVLKNDEDEDASGITITDDDLQTLNSNIKVYRYLNGMTYYNVLVKHFGDDLTPWHKNESPQPTTEDVTYYKKGGNSYTQITFAEAVAMQADGESVYTKVDVTNYAEVTGTILTTAIENDYPATNRDANYLGRYGMLRNNWYEIEVSGVARLGYASDPSVRYTIEGEPIDPDDPDPDPDPDDPSIPDDPTPDDHLSNWLKVNVNILSWAKRTQSEVLQ